MTVITDEDRKTVHDYIIHNLTMRDLQSERKEADKSNVKMKRVYLSAYQYQEIQALKRLRELRQEMNRRGIRVVWEQVADQDILEFRYLCRGVPSHVCLEKKELHKLIEEKQFEWLR
ncbi:hypothetical protein NLX67_22360 [Domibacillus sp. A3M-37]|uniref:hypothetical protein n=1 Tax=Domibacillus sp. A3M-37 TaxID=2962037 RepID=UPI0020B7B2A2|nr:hypothetical protein [Domibacillus sp. A3M-37]MCP3765050.1 hypothetical protein [Domibacillus sp. A3M-37]